MVDIGEDETAAGTAALAQRLETPTPLPAVDKLVRLTRTLDSVSQMPYIADLSFARKALVIKAGLGKGKTTVLIRHLQQSHYTSVLIASPRRSFARTIHERLATSCRHLSFQRYDSVKGDITAPYVICQSESFHRLKRPAYDLLVLDEVESFLAQLTSTETHRHRHLTNVRVFESILSTSQRLLMMDAFLSDRTISLLEEMAIPFHLTVYNQPQRKRTCQQIDSLDGLVRSLLADLNSEKRIFFFCTSHEQLTSYILPMLRRELPKLTALEYHRTSPTQLDGRMNINKLWAGVQLVATTSAITVGCNFDTPDVFHRVYVYASAACSNLVRDIFQATYRVRHLVDNHMVYCLDPRHYGQSMYCDEEHIRQALDRKERLITASVPTPAWLSTLHVRNELERHVSIMHLSPLFHRYLRECNYVNELFDAELGYQLDALDFRLVELRYDAIPELYPDQVCALLQRQREGVITRLEEAQLMKYRFQNAILSVQPQVKARLWDLYVQKYGARRFRNLAYERGLHEGAISLHALTGMDKKAYRALNDAFSLQCRVLLDVVSILHINHTHDFDAAISVDKLCLLGEYLKRNEAKIRTAFKLRLRRNARSDIDSYRYVVDVMNQMLGQWGYSKLQRRTRKRRRTDGEQVDDSVYGMKQHAPNNELELELGPVDVYKHICPKTRRHTLDRLVE